MSTREEAKIAHDLRVDAEALLALIAADLEKVGAKCSIDYAHMQLIPGDLDFFHVRVDLDDKDAATKAVMDITFAAKGAPITFSRLDVPKAVEFCANLHDEKQAIVARVIRAFDPLDNKFVRRLDFLFKVSPGLNESGQPESAVTPSEPSTKE